ncbi:TVP38/TMEM64 family protein [Acetobacter orientalis]|uniref:TVP38/TMEM64 family protein n=1 Tax=Acetobacter orientalis TaxID=146474 RepID=UPI000A36B088|nr:VTT domain-containing protein [Acetobacter orientalis]
MATFARVTSVVNALNPACGPRQEDASAERMEPALPPVKKTAFASVMQVLRPAIMLGLLVVGAVVLRHVGGLGHSMQSTALLRAGVVGRCLFVVGATVWCAFGLPRQVAAFTAGLAYGVAEGTVLITLASTLGCIAGFYWARWGGQAWARAKLGTRFARMDAMLTRQPFLSILTLRLLPVGSALLLNILGGISGIRLLPFAAATLLGGLPQNGVAVLLGSGVQLGAWWQSALGVGLFVASALLGVWLWRRSRLGALMSATAPPEQ